MPSIPEQLKWYTPLGFGASSGGPAVWHVSVDEMTGCVEIKRAPLFKLAAVMMGIIVGAIIAGACFATYTYAPVLRLSSRCLLAS